MNQGSNVEVDDEQAAVGLNIVGTSKMRLFIKIKIIE